MSGEADFWADGQWNFTCQLCGRKQKSGRAMRTWNNLYVCKHHKEVRNPQDFIRGVKEQMSVPWTRPQGPDQFVPPVCSLQGTNAIPHYAIPGCAIPAYVNTAFIPTAQAQAAQDAAQGLPVPA